MIPTPYEEDLACASSPYRFTWPRELLHGPSPLARQERLPSSFLSSQTTSTPSSKLPPFGDVFEAAAEPPPPYTELPRVAFASCYALAYDRPLEFQHHVIPVPSPDESMEDVEMSIDDELQYLGQLTIDMSSEFGELETPSPTSTSFAQSSPSYSLVGPWRVPRQRQRRSLLRRKPNPAGQRALACLRMNFILQNVPHLAVSLRQFEDRALTPVADVFYSWYEQLSPDQRVRYMPWFVPERLDLVKTDKPANAQAAAASPEAGAGSGEKATSQGTTVPSQSKAAAMAAAAHEAMKRKAARSTSPPTSCTSLPGWEGFDQAVRLLRVMPNRQASKHLRKEATIRAWKDSVAQLGWTQWDRQVVSCSKWRDVKMQMAEQDWKAQSVPFEDGQYSAMVFPSSWRRHQSTQKPNDRLLY